MHRCPAVLLLLVVALYFLSAEGKLQDFSFLNVSVCWTVFAQSNDDVTEQLTIGGDVLTCACVEIQCNITLTSF